MKADNCNEYNYGGGEEMATKLKKINTMNYIQYFYIIYIIYQQSSTFLAVKTGFMDDNHSPATVQTSS